MNKKVLIIGPDFFGYSKSVKKAFQKLGYKTDIINYRKSYNNTLFTRARLRFEPIFKMNYYKNMVINKTNQLILKKYLEFKPEVVMVIKGDILTKNTFKKMKDSIIILWMMDSILEAKEAYKNIDLYDYRFMFEKTDVDKLKNEGIDSFFLPLALDESVYFPIKKQVKDIDLLFVGYLNFKRQSLLENLIKDFPKLNIQIYGGYIGLIISKKHFKYYFKGYKKYFKNKEISPSEVNELYSKTKIAINIHDDQSKYGCNPRFFEILGTRTFQLVDNNKFIDEYFSDKVISYTSYDDLNNKIKKYIDNENLRASIAEKGYQEAINNHTFIQRVKYILTKLGD